MKKIMWVLLLVGILGAGMVLAQNGPQPGGIPPPALREQMEQREQIELRNRVLDIQSREEKVRFEREMGNLQLEQRRMANERENQAWAERGVPPMERLHRQAHHGIGFLFLLCGAVHILMAVWVSQDIKRRNSGSGIWVAVALLTGLCGVAVYALVRLGEKVEISSLKSE